MSMGQTMKISIKIEFFQRALTFVIPVVALSLIELVADI